MIKTSAINVGKYCHVHITLVWTPLMYICNEMSIFTGHDQPRYVQDIHGAWLWVRTMARSLLDGKQGTHYPRGGGHAVKDTVGQGKITFLVGSSKVFWWFNDLLMTLVANHKIFQQTLYCILPQRGKYRKNTKLRFGAHVMFNPHLNHARQGKHRAVMHVLF